MNQATDNWDAFKAEFHRDGSLRDIYVFGTSLEDWRQLASHVVAGNYKFSFSGAWSKASFPEDIASLFPTSPEQMLTVLTIEVSGVLLNCHFFSEDEIELDLDPGEVDDPSKLDAIFAFMSGVARALDKDVFLTPENMPEIRIFQVRPHADQVEHAPFGGFT